jgi:hypothetical protein
MARKKRLSSEKVAAPLGPAPGRLAALQMIASRCLIAFRIGSREIVNNIAGKLNLSSIEEGNSVIE